MFKVFSSSFYFLYLKAYKWANSYKSQEQIFFELKLTNNNSKEYNAIIFQNLL